MKDETSGILCIVDDEEFLRELLKLYFVSEGYSVFDFYLGEDVLKFLEDQKNPRRVRLIISDVNMPGMTGIELLDMIVEKYAEIPVILMTANKTSSLSQLAREKGAHSFIEKPFDLDELSKIVGQMFKEN